MTDIALISEDYKPSTSCLTQYCRQMNEKVYRQCTFLRDDFFFIFTQRMHDLRPKEKTFYEMKIYFELYFEWVFLCERLQHTCFSNRISASCLADFW